MFTYSGIFLVFYQLNLANAEYCRHEFFQKPEEVVVTIFAKGILAKNVAVDFGEQIVCSCHFRC